MPIGGKPVALTHDHWYKQGPAWSPDGKTLAYVTDRNGIENVYLHPMSAADDSADRAAVAGKSAQIMPAWSPDGKSLAAQDQTGATVLLDLASSTIKPLAPSTFFPGRASFAPNGKTALIATIKPYTKRFREGTSAILAVDLRTHATKFFSPAPFESVTTRTEDGPVYAHSGKEIAFVMDDLLYTMPVSTDGYPTGTATPLNDETTDAPTWTADSKSILYLSNGKLRLLDRTTKAIRTIPVDLAYTPAKPTGTVLIHAARFWKGKGPAEQTDVDVLVRANRIVSITPHSATPPAGIDRVIEAPNSTVLPGLWESHVHADSDNGIYYGDRMGRLWLSYGITELNGVADNAYRAVAHRESYLSGASGRPPRLQHRRSRRRRTRLLPHDDPHHLRSAAPSRVQPPQGP